MFKGKRLHWNPFLNNAQDFWPATLLKETPTQVFSIKYSEIFKNTYFEEHLRTAASEFYKSF